MLGFDPPEIADMSAVLAAVLLLGDVGFADVPGSTDDEASITDAAAVQTVADVLQVGVAEMENALQTRHIVLSGETIHKPLDASGCRVMRDTMAQHMYDNLFAWLVGKLNTVLGEGLKGTRACVCASFLIGMHMDEGL